MATLAQRPQVGEDQAKIGPILNSLDMIDFLGCNGQSCGYAEATQWLLLQNDEPDFAPRVIITTGCSGASEPHLAPGRGCC